MTPFTPDKLLAIRKVAEKYGVPEFSAEAKKGIFYEPISKVLIDCQHPSKDFPGLPTIGISNLIETDEHAGGNTIDTIRDEIKTTLDTFPKDPAKTKEKFKPKVEHDSAKQGRDFVAPNPTRGKVRKLHQILIGTDVCVNCGKPFDAWKDTLAEECTGKKDEINLEAKTEKGDGLRVCEIVGCSSIAEQINTMQCSSGLYCRHHFDEINGTKKPEVKHNENKTEKAKDVSPPAQKSPEPEQAKPRIIKNCYIKSCGIELSEKRKLECFQRDTENPIFICEDCEEKQTQTTPYKPEVMPPVSKQISRQETARMPVMAHTQQGTMIKGIAPSLAEIGKIKIGKKGELKKSQSTGKEFRIPKKLDHFEVTSIIRYEETGDFIPDPIMELLPKDPVELDIQLLFNDPTLNFITSYGYYQGGKCMCRGDGETSKPINPTPAQMEYINRGDEVPCNPESCSYFEQKKCKPNGILSVILSKSPRLGGVYKFRTTSINSIKSILSSMFFLATQTGGVLSMIPLKLTLSPKQVTPIVNGVPTPSTIYVVNIEYAGTVEDLLKKTIEVQTYQSKMRENLVKLEATARNILTAPEAPEDQKDFQEEYYPGQV